MSIETHFLAPRKGVHSVRDALTSVYQLAQESHMKELKAKDKFQFYAEILLTKVDDESVRGILISDVPQGRAHSEIQDDLAGVVEEYTNAGWIRMPHVWAVDSIALEIEIFNKVQLGI